MTTKSAIVTGGAQGIGKTIAGVLLNNNHKVGVETVNFTIILFVVFSEIQIFYRFKNLLS